MNHPSRNDLQAVELKSLDLRKENWTRSIKIWGSVLVKEKNEITFRKYTALS
jgi:hypothetical protein